MKDDEITMATIDYEKKYKALVEAVKTLKEANPSDEGIQNWVKDNVSELRESEDEKIRKAIINVFALHKDFEVFFGVSVEDILAWLEKQQKPIKEHNVCDFCEDRYGCVNPCPTKLIEEQKPADKVEPKFEIEKGKWYVCTQTYTLKGKIVVIKGQTYKSNQDGVIEGEDECLFVDKLDGKALNYFKPWTIQDAKDGDVLADGNLPFIFKKIDANKYSYAYCGISVDDGFKIESDGESGEWTWMQDIKPATKEQRDLLFQKMKEADYEWDAEKKELKKNVDKSSWSEEDESHIRYLIECLEHCKKGVALTMTTSTAQEYINWLKSLRPQINVTDEELAKAKKDAYNDALDKIEYHSGEPTFDDGWSAAIWYLKKKNARPQPTWKPSDEQMSALSKAIAFVFDSNSDVKHSLESLYNELKKL